MSKSGDGALARHSATHPNVSKVRFWGAFATLTIDKRSSEPASVVSPTHVLTNRLDVAARGCVYSHVSMVV